jgi:hypothetical protein
MNQFRGEECVVTRRGVVSEFKRECGGRVEEDDSPIGM